ncbi:MAG: hypothetical protein WDW36_006721 [Sanguina aurantia]
MLDDRTPQEIYPVFPRLRDADTNQPIGATPWTWADSPEEEDDSDTPAAVTPAWNPRTGFMQETRDVPGTRSQPANAPPSAGAGQDSAAASGGGSGRAEGEPARGVRVRQRRSSSAQAAAGSPTPSGQAVAASRAAVLGQTGELPAVGKGQILSACWSTSFWMCVAAVVIRGTADLSAAAVLGTDPEQIQQLLQLPSGLESVQNAAIMVTVVAGVTAARFALLTSWPEFQAATQRSNQQVLEPLNYLDIAIVATLTGVSEELLFRSAIIPATSPDWVGVLIAGVVFGVLHNSGGRNVAFAGWASAVGVVYGAAFLFTHNIWVVAGAHALANLSSAVAWKRGFPALSWRICCSSPVEHQTTNPLEQLRSTHDPVERSRLLQELDSCWRECSESYKPCAVELCLISELGVAQDAAMMLCTSSPHVAQLSVPLQVLPSLTALKAAQLDVADIFFLVSKKPALLLGDAECLTRWLDFLGGYGLGSKQLQGFLWAAPASLLAETSLLEAGRVLAFLKSLGIPAEFLSARVLCTRPALLARSVDTQLQPVVSALLRLGLSAGSVSSIVCRWPELLLRTSDEISAFSSYLTSLGCSAVSAGEVLFACPHLLAFPAAEVYRPRLDALHSQLGMGEADVRAMLKTSISLLIQQGELPLGALLDSGLSQSQVRSLLLACPDVLSQREADLARKLAFVRDTLREDVGAVVQWPGLLSLSLALVVGPRQGYMKKLGLGGIPASSQQGQQPAAVLDPGVSGTGSSLDPDPRSASRDQESSQPSSANGEGSTAMDVVPDVGAAGGGGRSGGTERGSSSSGTSGEGADAAQSQGVLTGTERGFDFGKLFSLPDDDVAWVDSVGGSVNEYTSFKKRWEDGYDANLYADAAQEFQAELKRLGVYEGL